MVNGLRRETQEHNARHEVTTDQHSKLQHAYEKQKRQYENSEALAADLEDYLTRVQKVCEVLRGGIGGGTEDEEDFTL